MNDKNIAGQTITLPGFIIQSEFGCLMHASCEMPQHGYVTVMPISITFTVPADFNSVAGQVAVLNKKLDAMADEYHGQVAHIKERIASLLCIENSPSEAATDDIVDADWPL